MKTLIITLMLIFISGCSSGFWHPDHRVRIETCFECDNKISQYEYEQLRLYVLRTLRDEYILQKDEKWLRTKY